MQALWEFKVEIIELVVTIMWLIWFLRNYVVHEAAPWSACGIIDKVEGLLAKFKAANSSVNTVSSSHVVN